MKCRNLAAVAAAAAMSFLAVGSAGATQFEGVVATLGGEERVMAAEVRAELEKTALRHETMGLSRRDAVALGLDRRLRTRLVNLDVKKRKLLDGDLGDRFSVNEFTALATVYRRERQPAIVVTDREIDQAMPAGPMERIRLRYIVCMSRDLVKNLLQRVRAGEDFAALAREFSEGPAAESGGDIGWLDREENRYFTEEHWSSIQKLPAGGVSEIFPSRIFEQGWTIARVDEIKAIPADEIAAIRKALKSHLQEKKFDEEMAQMVRSSALVIKEDKLRTLASADRREPLATFTGGLVTAGMFRRHLERGGVELAKTEEKVLGAYLKNFAELAVVATAVRKSPIMTGNPEIVEGMKMGTEAAIFSHYLDDVYADIVVSDEEIKRRFQERPEENERPEQVDLWQIHVASEAEAEECIERLKKGEDLETLAVLFAWTDKERDQAGHVGLVKRTAFAAPVADIVFSLGLMQVSKPIATRFGYYLYQVRKKIPAVKLTLEQRAEGLRAQLLEEKKEAAFFKMIENLRKAYPVKVDNAALDKI